MLLGGSDGAGDREGAGEWILSKPGVLRNAMGPTVTTHVATRCLALALSARLGLATDRRLESWKRHRNVLPLISVVS